MRKRGTFADGKDLGNVAARRYALGFKSYSPYGNEIESTRLVLLSS